MRAGVTLSIPIFAVAMLAQQAQQTQMSNPMQSAQQPMSMSTSGQEPLVKTIQQGTFNTPPNLPGCFTQVVERGDPRTGPYIAFVKLASGCTLPWHWHTANEDLMFTSGTGQFQAKGQQPQTVSEGAYVSMPSRHQHQLACPSGCSFYLTRDGAADIHYVDAAGNEISPETALTAFGERPVKVVSAR